MLSILMKRRAQAGATHPAVAQASPAAQDTVRRGMADKPWEDVQATLKQDLAYLRTLAGSKEKDPFKATLIDKYRPLALRLLDTHQGEYGNLDVLWWYFIWHVDLGQFEAIHDAFRAAIDGGLASPTNWKMNGQTAFCGYVFKYAHDAHTQKQPFQRGYLLNAVNDLLSGALATNAPLKVKMFRLVGDWYYDDGEPEKAHRLFEQVMTLDPDKGGRKNKLKELKETLGYDLSH